MTPLDPRQARAFAKEVVVRLRDAGFQALWAGGCVRDELLGRIPKDYDVATSARPEQVRQVFGRRRTLAIGASFGVISVRGPRPAGHVEVATFRTDSQYSDGRHPDAVQFSSDREDAQRRDFTVNGLFYDPLEQRVIDYVGGAADLEAKLIRAIGAAEQRIAEDKLRMLRAVRCAATFEFEIESRTLEAVQRHAEELSVVSAERVAAELRKTLLGRGRVRGLELLRLARLLGVVLPESRDWSEDHWLRVKQLVAALPDDSDHFSQPLAALCCESEAGPAGGEPPGEAVRRVEEVGQRWRLTNQEVAEAAHALNVLPLLLRADQLPWPGIQRVLVAAHTPVALPVAEAFAAAHQLPQTGIEFCRQRLQLPREELDPPPLVNGGDLIRLGLPPGPRFKELLESVRDRQLLGELRDRETALGWIQQIDRAS